jgi:hypothetical protein
MHFYPNWPPARSTNHLSRRERIAFDCLVAVLDHSYEARYLPLALERLQFGIEADDKPPRSRAAAQFADSLGTHVRAFVVRAFSVPKELSAPVRRDLIEMYRGSTERGSSGRQAQY